MAYTDFTIQDLRINFNIVDKKGYLFKNVTAIPSSEWLQQTLARSEALPMKSEKARSEWVITPILLELRHRNNNFFTIYSGDTLTADKSQGLNGECDFILARDTQAFAINVPILCLVEAKKQDMETGIEQCAAQMIGAKRYNEKFGQQVDRIYGCVTTADVWKFLTLEGQLLTVDIDDYFISNLELILGIFQEIIDYYKSEKIKN